MLISLNIHFISSQTLAYLEESIAEHITDVKLQTFSGVSDTLIEIILKVIYG